MLRRIRNLWRLSDIDMPTSSKDTTWDKIKWSLPGTGKAEIISLKSRVDEITNETTI